MNVTRITELRRARGWTQEHLASESGVAVRTIQRLEAGSDASLETLGLVAGALQVPVRDLFRKVEDTGFQAVVDGLDMRAAAQQRRRDIVTQSVRHVFCLIGAMITLTIIALALSGRLSAWAFLAIPGYWVLGYVASDLLTRLTVDPWLERRYPLSRSSVGRDLA